MSLTSILLYATSVLAVFSGFSAFIGASKTDKKKMAWFFATTIMAAIWTVSIAMFLDLPITASESAPFWIMSIYISSAVMMVMLLGYAGWEYTVGKILTFLAVVALVITTPFTK